MSRLKRLILMVTIGWMVGGSRATTASGMMVQSWDSCPAIPSSQGLLKVQANTALNVDCTIRANVILDFSEGGTISVKAGRTLTLEGGMSGPITQRFTGAGRVKIASAKIDAVYPQWWGALANGSNDDAAAINAAMASLVNGGTVRLPPGRYRITRSLVMKPNVNLIGAGQQSSLIQAFNCDAVTFGFYTGDTHNVTISDLGIEGIGGTTHRAIYQSGSDSITDELYGVTITNTIITHFNTVIQAKSTRNWTIRDNWFQHINSGIVLLGQDFVWNITGNRIIYGVGNGAGNSDGIKLGYAKFTDDKRDVKPEGIQVSQNQIHGFTDTAINCDACIFTNFTNNDLASRTVGFRFSETAAVLNFKNNHVELVGMRATHAIWGVGQATILNTKINIEGNSLAANGVGPNVVGFQVDAYGVNSNQAHIRLAGNAFYNFTSYDIALFNTGDIDIESNDCYSPVPVSIYITGTLAGRPIHINRNYLTGYIKAPFAETHHAQIIVGENSGTYSTYIRGATAITNPNTSATTVYASLFGRGAIPNFPPSSATGFSITLHVGTPDVPVGSPWGSASESQVTINIERTPPKSVVIPWEVKMTQCTAAVCLP